jgi:hypothetical protein
MRSPTSHCSTATKHLTHIMKDEVFYKKLL